MTIKSTTVSKVSLKKWNSSQSQKNSLVYSNWVQSQKQQNDLSLFPRQAIQHHSSSSL